MSKYSASVSINATSNVKGVAKDIDKSLKKNNESLKKNRLSWQKTSAAMKSVGKAALIGSTAAVAGIGALIKTTANYGDDLAKTAQKTGLLVDEIQKLRFSAALGGASMGDLDTGVKVFSKAIDEAGQGTAEYADLFNRLNIETADANGNTKKTVDLIYEVADAFSVAEDNAAKTSIAQQLFGRGGIKMIPVLNKGAVALRKEGKELEKLGFIMNLDQAKASEQFNDDLLRMRTELAALGRSIAVDAIPHVDRIINKLRGGLKPLRDWISENVDLEKLFAAIGDAAENIDFGEILKDSFEGFKTVIGDIEEIVAALRELIDVLTGREIEAAYGGMASGITDLLGAPPILSSQRTQETIPLNARSEKDLARIPLGSTSQQAPLPQDINVKITVDQEGRVIRALPESTSKGINFESSIIMIPQQEF